MAVPVNMLMSSVTNSTVNNTLGAVVLGVVGASFLSGITFLQACLYFHRYTHDSRLHKIAVGALWTLDSLHMVLILHAVYTYAVIQFGALSGLSRVVWSIKLQVAINVIIILFVQSLYAYRVWIFGGYHHGVLGYLVASVVAGGFAIGIVVTYEIYSVDTFESLQNIAWSINSSLATSTAIDFTIASAMCYYLRKSQGSESRLNLRISTVMQYTLSSGLLTSACSLSTLFTYTLMPNTLVFLGLQFLSTKLYIGSFLAMLNSRQQKSDSHCGNRSSQINSSELAAVLRLPSIEFRVHTTTITETHRSSLRCSPPTGQGQCQQLDNKGIEGRDSEGEGCFVSVVSDSDYARSTYIKSQEFDHWASKKPSSSGSSSSWDSDIESLVPSPSTTLPVVPPRCIAMDRNAISQPQYMKNW